MNKVQENRKKLLEFLKELPEERFDYSIYFAHESHGCGAVGCVAGWCREKFAPGLQSYYSPVEFSTNFLKLSEEEAKFLFYHRSECAKLSDAIKRLQWLVDHGCFEGYPLHKESWNNA